MYWCTDNIKMEKNKFKKKLVLKLYVLLFQRN